MPKYHLLDTKGELKRIYRDVEVDIRPRVIRLYSTEPPYETVAVISMADGDRLEHVTYED